MERILQDLRYAVRAMRRRPGFAAVAAVTLALGIGANTAIFSIVNAVLLAPLPFTHPDQLVMVRAVENGRTEGPSPADALDYARANHTLEESAVYDTWRKNVSGVAGSQDAEERVVGLAPTAYFNALRIRPLIGRLFRDEENEYGKHYVAVIDSTFWRQHYGSDPKVLGQSIRINDEPYTIIGVIPDSVPPWMSLVSGMSAQIWTPFAPSANYFAEASRGDRGSLAVLARLKPGVTLPQAEADLNLVAAQLAQRYPVDQGIGVKLEPLANVRVGPLRPVLLLLTAAVGLILLIACSNVANLLLVRHSGRRREFALRAALGGARPAMIRQLAVESFVLAVLGGGIGLLLAVVGERLVLLLRPQQFLQLGETRLDARVLLFSVGLSLLTIIISGLAPAFTATRVNLVDALNEGGRASTASAGRQRLRRGLVVAETALSLMLMIAAGLLLQTIMRLQRQELGFNPTHLLRGHLYVPPASYPDSPALTRFVDQLRERVAALPGTREATITTLFPPRNRWDQYFSIIGNPPSRLRDLPSINFGLTDEHYLPTFGIPLLRGRNFAASDIAGNEPVAIINQAAVRRFFPNLDPVGRRVHLGDPNSTPVPGSSRASADLTVIGVMADTRNQGLAQPAAPQLIALYRQVPALNFGFKELVLRTAQEPFSLVPAIRDELRRLDPDVPLAEITTMDEIVTRQTSDTRFTTVLLGLFAGLGTALAMIGVYGVISYAVAQRTHEIGVRVALGARGAQVLWLVLRPGLAMGLLGAGLGLMGAAAARRLLSALLFGISPLDPATFIAAAGLLLGAVLLACALPARRASRVDPMIALRYE